ncbi:DUF2949 domain-containing protein [Myxacorys almedinensis]|uniref:DUF2949 domain-containing protein n=1 Tax=Myxacorys almedinensis A TaxID=2690445 RepID=A0A8J8CLB5_9CYAN|nr:DUF2949 domain-containing protein [Myxacorys almedinensis]NDJ17585.1 DUF2949 domain-containing protein [Myxacorys almedinensis A]
METKKRRAFIKFLKEELALPTSAIDLAVRHGDSSSAQLPHLPMILWQYGLITIAQLDQIFDWMEQA